LESQFKARRGKETQRRESKAKENVSKVATGNVLLNFVLTVLYCTELSLYYHI